MLGEKALKQKIESGDIYIAPYIEEHVEPASIDLRLGNHFTVISATDDVIDTRDEDSITHTSFERESITLEPGANVLGTTVETVGIPDTLVGQVQGRSSLGRLSVVVHKTAGIIDPGYRGEITLEIENEGVEPVRLHAGDRVCQILFEEVVGGVETPYGEERGSQYQGQSGATPSGMGFSSEQ